MLTVTDVLGVQSKKGMISSISFGSPQKQFTDGSLWLSLDLITVDFDFAEPQVTTENGEYIECNRFAHLANVIGM